MTSKLGMVVTGLGVAILLGGLATERIILTWIISGVPISQPVNVLKDYGGAGLWYTAIIYSVAVVLITFGVVAMRKSRNDTKLNQGGVGRR